MPMASRSTPNKISMAHMDLIVPNLCCSLGAINTDVIANNKPHPKNT